MVGGVGRWGEREDGFLQVCTAEKALLPPGLPGGAAAVAPALSGVLSTSKNRRSALVCAVRIRLARTGNWGDVRSGVTVVVSSRRRARPRSPRGLIRPFDAGVRTGLVTPWCRRRFTVCSAGTKAETRSYEVALHVDLDENAAHVSGKTFCNSTASGIVMPPTIEES